MVGAYCFQQQIIDLIGNQLLIARPRLVSATPYFTVPRKTVTEALGNS